MLPRVSNKTVNSKHSARGDLQLGMSDSLRVLMTILNFYPVVGGGEQQCLRLCKALRAGGIDARVLTYQLRPEWPIQDKVDGVPVTRLKLPKLRLPGLSYLCMLFHLLQHRGEYDIIHNHGIHLHTAASVAAGKLSNKPVVTLFYNTGERADLRLVRQQLPRPFSKMVERAVFSADAVAAICEAIRDELLHEGLPAGRIVSIPNGVDRDSYTPANKDLQRVRRRKLGLPEDATVILRVGTLMPKKGVGVLLEAWQQVSQRCAQALLVSVGGYPEEVQQLARLWDNRVQFIPNTDDVLLYLQAADVFVLPSFTEGLSNALLEAQACGLASVVTRVGGNPEVVNHGENGLIVEAGDVDSLATALTTLVDNPALRTQMGQRARAKSKRYAMPWVVQQYVTLYQQLVNRKRHK